MLPLVSSILLNSSYPTYPTYLTHRDSVTHVSTTHSKWHEVTGDPEKSLICETRYPTRLLILSSGLNWVSDPVLPTHQSLLDQRFITAIKSNYSLTLSSIWDNDYEYLSMGGVYVQLWLCIDTHCSLESWSWVFL